MFVWMAKFGAAYGVRTGIHVGVDVLINRMNRPEMAQGLRPVRPAGRRAVHRHRRHPGRDLRDGTGHTDQTSEDLEMPMWIVYLACRSAPT
jgi:C4-dicarboxylate transporter DctQ subunit